MIFVGELDPRPLMCDTNSPTAPFCEDCGASLAVGRVPSVKKSNDSPIRVAGTIGNENRGRAQRGSHFCSPTSQCSVTGSDPGSVTDPGSSDEAPDLVAQPPKSFNAYLCLRQEKRRLRLAPQF